MDGGLDLVTSVIGIIQARMSSTRLPAKILAPLAGRPLLALLTARLRSARVDEWWLATTSEPADDVTEAWGHALGLSVYRGESEDVLSRFAAIIRRREPEWVIRMTADNPFCDGEIVNVLLDARDEQGKDVSLLGFGDAEPPPAGAPTAPLGYGAQLARADAVLRAEAKIPADQPHHRAHVLTWIEQQEGAATASLPLAWPHRPDWRWTVDTFEDLAMARSAFELLGLRATDAGYPTIVAELDRHPEITSMNRHVRQKAIEEG